MREIDVTTLTIAQIQQGLAAKRFTAEQLTEAHLAQIARHNPASTPSSSTTTRPWPTPARSTAAAKPARSSPRSPASPPW